MASSKRPALAQRLILDSGAVIAVSRGDQRARAYLQRAVELDAEVRIPVVVVAETMRGGARDAPVHRLLNAVGRCEATPESVGRLAGELLGRARRDDTVDALVVAEAIVSGGGRILTSDPEDLSRLADHGTGVEVVALQR